MNEGQVFEQTVLITRPDANTAEAITYGDEYQFYKSSKWWWDALEDELNRQLEQEMAKLRDIEFCSYVVNNRPNMIWSRQPPVNEPDKQRDLMQLREVVKRGTALRDLNVRRTKNEMYARLKGVDKHTKEIREKSIISDNAWMAATCGKNDHIDYEMLRELLDDDRDKAAREAEQMELSIKEYNEAKEKFAKDYEAWLKAKDAEDDPNRIMESDGEEPPAKPKEPFDITKLPIYMESLEAAEEADGKGKAPKGDSDDPSSEEYWRSGSEVEGDAEEDAGEESDDGAPAYPDWMHAPMHALIREELDSMPFDAMDWLLGAMEVAA